MFCSSCGLEATLDVNFCKRCGRVLSPQVAAPPITYNLTGPSWAMAVALMVMVGTIFGAVVKLARLNVSAVALTWMVIVGLGSLIALVAMIFRQLARMTQVNQQKIIQPTSTPPIAGELYNARPGALPEHMPSVTEHTTRAFEPAYREPSERRR